jgi:hypothetical protein
VPPPRRTQSTRGDQTGRTREHQAREAADDLRERQQEISMINQVQDLNDDLGVYDPESNELLEGPEVAVVEEIIYAEDDEAVIDTLAPRAVEAIPLEVEEMEESIEVQEATRIIRIAEDCEPTIGYGNNYDFKAGRRYRVPAHVARHLEEKGLVYH